ncbi:hypothetical protein Lalb_Chr11g0073781 [Lupinus albus]|uniref:Uncharacterized protein n=1 Tax=Lupinus albus TaxID=3870 RepID=A0A6A4PTM7_LUPAL|nr:hypothetical protein Lalb_Chr11g0073781 [Lupinus albus]
MGIRLRSPAATRIGTLKRSNMLNHPLRMTLATYLSASSVGSQVIWHESAGTNQWIILHKLTWLRIHLWPG